MFVRQSDGTLKLTASGEVVAQRAEAMERQFDLIGEALAQITTTALVLSD